jgi:hypothetical protein
MEIVNMFKLLLVIVSLISINANASVSNIKKQLELIDSDQLYNLVYAYNYGLDYDLEYTLAAIAWVESKAGKYPVRLDVQPSCGVFHNRVLTVAIRENVPKSKLTPFKRSAICSTLIKETGYSASHAIKELTYWKRRHNGNINKMWAAYNSGSAVNPEYVSKIRNTIRALRELDILYTITDFEEIR